MKLILVGGVSFKGTSHPHIGGTTVLMDNLVEYCETNSIPHCVIPTNIYHGRFRDIRNFLYLLQQFLVQTKKGDVVMVNVSSKKGIITLFPIVFILSRLKGAQVVLRKFAGSIHTYLENSDIKQKIAFYFLRKTKLNYFETHELIEWFKNNQIPCVWFPNVRKPHNYRVSMEFMKRFVFISQIHQEKGIDMLLEISNMLPEDYTIDIYGPIIDSKYDEIYFRRFKASYKGVLLPDQVIPKLSEYNMMLLPTYWHAEGYPGVIIEAMSLGMPVISTKIGGIPELIDNGRTGILTEVNDLTSFYNAILSIDGSTYRQLVTATINKYDSYNSELVNRRVINEMIR